MKKTISWMLCLMLMTGTCIAFPASGEQTEDALPASFDLRSVDTDGDGVGDRCYVTPVRQQGPFGTCWGFAAIGTAEISILGSLYDHDPDAWKTLNLSEKQLVYFSHVPLDDPDNPQNGEGPVVNDFHDAREVYNTGGTGFLATSTFAQGIGPSSEDSEETGSYFRYSGKEMNAIRQFIRGSWRPVSYSDDDDWTIPEEYRFTKDFLLRESFLLPSPAGEDDEGNYRYNADAVKQIKQQLLQKRGVSIGFRADVSNPDQEQEEEGLYLNTKTWAHYTWDEGSPNHEVTLIGWDDYYPKENFVSDHQPPADGAWLVKNSWGSGENQFPDSGRYTWGIQVPLTDEEGNPLPDDEGNPVMVGSGYFWLSYYDTSLENPEAFVFDYAVAPETVDQHDYMQTARFDVEQKDQLTKMANVFVAKQNQILSSISCITVDPDSEVSWEIYLLCEDYENPEDGVRVASGERSFPYGGYHKIALPEEPSVVVQKGQPYAILVTIREKAGNWVINQSVAFEAEGLADSQHAVINEKESYLYTDGAWTDYRDITQPEDSEETSTMSYDNFPLKGYSYGTAGAMILCPSIANPRITSDEGSNQTTVTLSLRGLPDLDIGTPEIEWTLLNGSDTIAEITPEKGGSRVLLTATGEGTIYLGVSAKDPGAYGTSVVKLPVYSHIPASASAVPRETVWNGEGQYPAIDGMSAGGNILYEGEDFFVSFRNNVQCGIALADIRMQDDEDSEPVLTVSFAIVPEKAEITAAEVPDGRLKVVLRDQWESGITGYEIEYRTGGNEDWTTEKLTDGTEWILENPETGLYEIRVRAYVETTGDEGAAPEGGRTVLFGETSDMTTVTVE